MAVDALAYLPHMNMYVNMFFFFFLWALHTGDARRVAVVAQSVARLLCCWLLVVGCWLLFVVSCFLFLVCCLLLLLLSSLLPLQFFLSLVVTKKLSNRLRFHFFVERLGENTVNTDVFSRLGSPAPPYLRCFCLW